jgi:hypothetical protein
VCVCVCVCVWQKGIRLIHSQSVDPSIDRAPPSGIAVRDEDRMMGDGVWMRWLTDVREGRAVGRTRSAVF